MAILRREPEKFENGYQFPDLAMATESRQLTTGKRVTLFEGLLNEAYLV